MIIDFLVGSSPLTKTYTLQEDGSYDKSSYPNAFNVSSIRHEVDSIVAFHEALVAHAGHGHCLLKGQLSKQLNDESRAGLVVNTTPTEWVVFDVDDLEGVESPEAFVTEFLPPEFHDVSYIVQHSCSAGITDKGARWHLFFMLESPVSPDDIKRWFTYQNLKEVRLSQQLKLSKNLLTAKMALDRTVAENGKLIFIAPPVCQGFTDPLNDRISLVKCTHDKVSFLFPTPSRQIIDGLLQDRIDEMRGEQDLPEKHGEFVTRGDYRILLNPDEMKITDTKEQNGFIRCNVNDGDSWAYWYNPRNPEFLHNFKGEPSVPIHKSDPAYFAEHIEPGQDKQNGGFVVYRDKVTANHYHLEWDEKSGEIIDHWVVSKGDVGALCDYLKRTKPKPIPTYHRLFDPRRSQSVDLDSGVINLYAPTEYQRRAKDATSIPPVCEKILRHVVGDDEEALQWILNWLAYIYQTRRKTGIAVVLHGVQGTGKGLLFNNIITPIFGEQYCVTRLLNTLTDRFNSYLETSLFVNFDEARLSDLGRESSRINNEFKNIIVAPRIGIRGMRENFRETDNYTNFLLTANQRDILPEMERNERRLTVCPRQETPISITNADIEEIENELLQLAGFFKGYAVGEGKATRPLENPAKEQLYLDNLNSVQEFTLAFTEGDISYFVDGYQTRKDAGQIDYEYVGFKKTLDRWASGIGEKGFFVPTAELLVVYRALTDAKINAKKFGKLLQHKNVSKSVNGRIAGGPVVKGRRVTWQATPSQLVNIGRILEVPVPKVAGNVVEGVFDGSTSP